MDKWFSLPGNNSNEVDTFRLQLILLEKMPEELAEHTEKLKLDLLERHEAGMPLERNTNKLVAALDLRLHQPGRLGLHVNFAARGRNDTWPRALRIIGRVW